MLSRRDFVAGLMAAPFLGLLRSARAQGGPRAKRLLIFSSPNGTIHRRWRPEAAAGAETRDFRFPAGGILEPLAPWKDRLVVVDGLNFLTGNNHEGGQAAMLTNGGGAGTPTRGMSIDQFLARRVGADDRFPSLEFGVLTDLWGANIQTRISYSGAGELVHPDADPRRAFERMFGDLTGGPTEAARLKALRQSVLDLGRAELADLHRRVGRAEQIKLEAHLESLRSVEQSLFGELTCDAPDAPDPLGKDVNDNAPALLTAQMRLAVTALLADQYRAEAERLAEAVELARVLPCGATDRACAVTFVRDFGRQLMRRPLTADEQAGYLRIYDLAAEVGFETGIRWTLTAMLQSPHFLYRTELGRRADDGFTLTSYEVATELSYLFWQTTPDARLLQLAADGSLLDPAVVAAEVPRLLDDPRSAATMNRFADRWLGLDRLTQVTRDGELYPHLTDAVRAEMGEETRRTTAAAWRDGATLADLLRGSSRPMTATLAAYYDVPPPGDQWVATNLDGTPYGGLLTHGSVLVTHALPTGSSPIHRGLFVRERLLCQDLPDPPANLDTSPPPVDPTLSTRERYSQHATDDACSGCHRQIDPIGFAFEHFDADGRWRATDGVHAIDATGALTGTAASDATFDGVAQLADVLADSPDVAACYVTQWLRYGYGVDDTLPIACYVNQLTPQVDALSDVLPALAGLPHMMRRIGGEAELDVPGADLTPRMPGEIVEPPDPPEPPDVVDPPPPPPPLDDVTPGATLRLVEQSRWPTGYCVDAFVLNEGDADLRWAVAHAVEGRINNVWNATGTADSGRVIFRGADWNGTLAPSQEAQFGWCAEL